MINFSITEGTDYTDKAVERHGAEIVEQAQLVRRAFNAGLMWGINYHEEQDGPEGREAAYQSYLLAEMINALGGLGLDFTDEEQTENV